MTPIVTRMGEAVQRARNCGIPDSDMTGFSQKYNATLKVEAAQLQQAIRTGQTDRVEGWSTDTQLEGWFVDGTNDEVRKGAPDSAVCAKLKLQ